MDSENMEEPSEESLNSDPYSEPISSSTPSLKGEGKDMFYNWEMHSQWALGNVESYSHPGANHWKEPYPSNSLTSTVPPKPTLLAFLSLALCSSRSFLSCTTRSSIIYEWGGKFVEIFFKNWFTRRIREFFRLEIIMFVRVRVESSPWVREKWLSSIMYCVVQPMNGCCNPRKK